ncbi:hypothetical protein [Amphritea sp. HPY]|uniref:hypothetical protein n=1 Tax=Amphritea sp. HPY TaxID=3421652 RepID=UPI003D7CE58A
MMSQRTKVTQLRPVERDRSTVSDELDALDWSLQQIAVRLSLIEGFSTPDGGYSVESARRHLNDAVQRSYRAKQVSRGLKVYKA